MPIDSSNPLDVRSPAAAADTLANALINSIRPYSKYLKTRAMFSRLRARSGSRAGGMITEAGCGLILCAGDSNTEGGGSDIAANVRGYNGLAQRLADALKALGFNAASDNLLGMGGYATLGSYDDRIAKTGAAAVSSSLSTAGGKLFQLSAAGTWAFTAKTQSNKMDLYYFSGTGSGSITYSVDGGSATTLNLSTGASGAAPLLRKLTIDLGTVGLHTVTLTWVSGFCYFWGFDFYDSTNPRIHVWNCGWYGSQTSDWSGQNLTDGWSCIPLIRDYVKPDLIVGPGLGTNDQATTRAVPAATAKANLQTLITAWSASSDILMLSPGPRGDSEKPAQSVIDAYSSIYPELASENGLAIVDEFRLMGGDETVAKALGLYSTDDLHKTQPGQWTTAKEAARVLTSII